MNNKPYAHNQFDYILNKAASETGTSPDKLRQLAENNPMLKSALSNLSEADLNKISSIINDKETYAKILATPQAQELLKKLKKQ